MAGRRSLDQAIEAIQQGSMAEGERLLSIALRDDTLTPALKAAAYIWLAETRDANAYKVRCYEQALAADPSSEHAAARLAQLQQPPLPPLPSLPDDSQAMPASSTLPAAPNSATSPPPPTVPPPGSIPNHNAPTITDHHAQNAARQVVHARLVGLVDGPNGLGTGFFINTNGLLVTTRTVVGSSQRVTGALDMGLKLEGRVLRSFTQFDLALVQFDIQLSGLMPFAAVNGVTPNTPLTVLSFNQQVVQGFCRDTQRELPPEWIPTTIRQLADAGGGPVLDPRQQVVGMLTRNATRTSADVFALRIGTVLSLTEAYMREVKADPNRSYCGQCGQLSRAQAMGAFYCEYCGSVLPHAWNVQRFPRQENEMLYTDVYQPPCSTCGHRAGRHQGRCLRCGAPV